MIAFRKEELQELILSWLVKGRQLKELVDIEGFADEVDKLEKDGKIESEYKPAPWQDYYENYKITSYGRAFL
ncbi:hypothetical protein D3C87_1178820 [compost metagenome]